MNFFWGIPMALVDQIKNLLKTKTTAAEPALSTGLSEEASSDQLEAELRSGQTQYGATDASAAPAVVDGNANPAVSEEDADRISLPVLGNNTIVGHQRSLSVALGAALLLLVVVTS